MKTTHTPAAFKRAASHNLPGALLLISLLSSSLMSFDPELLTDVFQLCKTQWQGAFDWINSGMMHPHQTPQH